MIDIGTIKKGFINRFTYLAGDGQRMDPRAGTPDRVFEYFEKHLRERDELIQQLNGNSPNNIEKINL